ncbi:unnamed protein product, partial [Amoebophrya sp. A120]
VDPFEATRGRGLLLQVATGEGKTELLAGVATVLGLVFLKKIDIMTSSQVLAVRDVEKNRSLFDAFALRTRDNTHKAGEPKTGARSCYKEGEVLFGDPSDFMFDALKSEWYAEGTTGTRYGAKLPPDEVDMMLVNDLSRTAKVATPFPGAEFLEPIYHVLKLEMDKFQTRVLPLTTTNASGARVRKHILMFGDVLRRFQDEKDPEIEAIEFQAVAKHGQPVTMRQERVEKDRLQAAKNREKGLTSVHGASLVRIPKHWERHVKDTLPRLVKSALLAYFTFQENVDFIIQHERIKPVSGATGITQESLHWSDGIHQILEVMHGLPVTPESLPTNFLSNYAFFRRYRYVYGVTGTLGSAAVRNSLQTSYQLQSRIMPFSRRKQFLPYAPELISPERDRWVTRVVNNVITELQRDRGVLCICQNIEAAELIAKALKQQWDPDRVHEYMRQSNADVGSGEMEPFQRGMVIVSTNLAGRGTDYDTTAIEKYGGLHVELTFLAESREEAQALGRTARQGKKGTGRTTAMLGGSFQEQDVFDASAGTDAFRFDDFEQKELVTIKTQDLLYSTFLFEYQTFRSKLAQAFDLKSKSGLHSTDPTEKIREFNTLQAIAERWALFL